LTELIPERGAATETARTLKATPFKGPFYRIIRKDVEITSFRTLVPLNFGQQLTVLMNIAFNSSLCGSRLSLGQS
jgi:hypothetical protein